MNATLEATRLSAADRCDRCGAQAYVRATLPGGSALLFCNHHWLVGRERLLELATSIQDETDRLAGVPARRLPAAEC